MSCSAFLTSELDMCSSVRTRVERALGLEMATVLASTSLARTRASTSTFTSRGMCLPISRPYFWCDRTPASRSHREPSRGSTPDLNAGPTATPALAQAPTASPTSGTSSALSWFILWRR
ncbi:expressed unknown protein [Seminavis robusta]|uniref:Uncharacterized protein n=1 Tax=Seminavis robusta TaxID=568900 RepID=A0A9N8EWI5_9STRA|nr:expressed unknown protein [Seminavis robusta]|eukprot:Sro1969_g308461.1  (119) ;mRNA; f:5997-6353